MALHVEFFERVSDLVDHTRNAIFPAADLVEVVLRQIPEHPDLSYPQLINDEADIGSEAAAVVEVNDQAIRLGPQKGKAQFADAFLEI